MAGNNFRIRSDFDESIVSKRQPPSKGLHIYRPDRTENTLEAEGIEVELLHKEPMIFTNFHR